MLTFLSDNLLDDAIITVTEGEEDAQFPLSNLQQTFTTKVFRSKTSTCKIVLDLKRAYKVDSFAIVGSAITGFGISGLRIYGSPSNNFTGSQAREIDLDQGNNFGFNFWEADRAFRFWQIEFENVGGDYVELSNFFIGVREEILTNGLAVSSFNYAEKDKSNIAMNTYGQKFINEYNTVRTLSGIIEYANQDEVDTLSNLYNRHRLTRPLYFVLDKNDIMLSDSSTKFSGYFYFENDLELQGASLALYNVNLSLSEVI